MGIFTFMEILTFLELSVVFPMGMSVEQRLLRSTYEQCERLNFKDIFHNLYSDALAIVHEPEIC